MSRLESRVARAFVIAFAHCSTALRRSGGRRIRRIRRTSEGRRRAAASGSRASPELARARARFAVEDARCPVTRPHEARGEWIEAGADVETEVDRACADDVAEAETIGAEEVGQAKIGGAALGGADLRLRLGERERGFVELFGAGPAGLGETVGLSRLVCTQARAALVQASRALSLSAETFAPTCAITF